MFWREDRSRVRTLNEVFGRIVEKVERERIPFVAVGVSGRKGIYAEILYRLRFRYLGWSVIDGGCFDYEFPVCLRSHVTGGELSRRERNYYGCHVYDDGSLSYKDVKARIEAGIELSPKSYALHFVCSRYPAKEVVNDFAGKVNFLSFYRTAGDRESMNFDRAVYLLTAATPVEVELFGLKDEHVAFLERGTADRQHGLIIRDEEVIPVVLPLGESEYFEAKAVLKVGHDFLRKSHITDVGNRG